MSTYEFDDSREPEAETARGAEASDGEGASDDPLTLATRLELVEAENQTLRAEYARARRSTHRRSALMLGVLGLVALAGGLAFPASREVFVVLGATGLFGGVLTYYLAPTTVVAASVGERIYTAGARNSAALASELGLQDEHVYAPTDRPGSGRLYVPLSATYEVPTADGPLVLDDPERGLVLEATGGPLLAEFERAAGGLADSPAALATQLCDGLVEQFELAGRATPDVDAVDGRVTVSIAGSAFGAVDRFDHPIPSFLATGLAEGLDRPVTTEIEPGDGRADWLVTCRFDPDGVGNDTARE